MLIGFGNFKGEIPNSSQNPVMRFLASDLYLKSFVVDFQLFGSRRFFQSSYLKTVKPY